MKPTAVLVPTFACKVNGKLLYIYIYDKMNIKSY